MKANLAFFPYLVNKMYDGALGGPTAIYQAVLLR